MAATVRGAIRELIEQTMLTMGALLEASDRELSVPSSHGCAQGKDVWTLITNDIDRSSTRKPDRGSGPIGRSQSTCSRWSRTR